MLCLAAQDKENPPLTTGDKANACSGAKQRNDREARTDGQIAPKNGRPFRGKPNYTRVENRDRFSPVSNKGKFKLAADSSFDP